MENENRRKLYIPYGLNIEPEYFIGFGRTELKQCFIGIACFGVVAAVLMLITGNLAALVFTMMIGATSSIMMTRKDPITRLSVVGQVKNMVRFVRSQRRYRYVYKSKWF